MEVEVKIKNATNGIGIGTLAWTRAELINSDVRLSTSKTGNLMVASYRPDGTVATIIATEYSSSFPRGFDDATFFATISVAYCYVEEGEEGEEEEGDNRQCLFGRVLTPASYNFTQKFIEKCVEFLASAIAARNSTEYQELKTLSVEIKAEL
ncbi:MAG: hypothetical protein LBE11_06905 [Prevotellaceae bacterium]|jgi:hypothetical protein|nr:hypothetical protein [Prevotellaceae bacterium]